MIEPASEDFDYDVVIVGAGPAGCAAAIALSSSSLRIALIDKSTFPRDKICGDALSPDVVKQLHMLPGNVGQEFDQFQQKIWCKAVRFVAPNYQFADVKLEEQGLTGYVSPRYDFDHILFQSAKKCARVDVFENTSIDDIQINEQNVRIIDKQNRTFHSKIILGADGANSFVKRQLQPESLDRNHYCAGLRMYYQGVTGFSEDNAVELHFYRELLPGYFWVFPLPDGKANVGVGMLSSHIQRDKVDIKKAMESIIAHHPNVKDRFKNATPLENVKGFPLPLGSKKRKLSGNRYILLGDAASLINPLSGEGIANAIRSGRIAAEHILLHKASSFSTKINSEYDKEVYRRMWGELKLSYNLQRMMRYRWLCNLIVQRAIGSRWVQDWIMSGFNMKGATKSLLQNTFTKSKLPS